MTLHIRHHHSPDLYELVRRERQAFSAKIRMTRALLGWSQSEFGQRVGLTQRAIHKLEQGGTEPRRATIRAIEEVWLERGIEIEDLADGGFRITVRSPLIERPVGLAEPRHRSGPKSADLGVTRLAKGVGTHRA